jgi:hypothetical protein
MGLLFAFVCGMFAMLGYILWRMMRNDRWDDSNITNALRLLAHVTIHSEDFGEMFYLNEIEMEELKEIEPGLFNSLKRPFWYVSEDEFEGIVKTRPVSWQKL